MNGDDLAKNKEIINNLREQIDIKIHEFFPDVEKRVEKQIKNLTFRQTDPKDDDDDSLSATVYFIKKRVKNLMQGARSYQARLYYYTIDY